MHVLPAPAENLLLFDLSARAKLRLTGEDRLRFLNGQVSNDVRRASADESIYTCVMTLKGKMCADAFVHAGDGCLFVDAEEELRESLAARLERYIIADDVQLDDATDAFALLHLLPQTPADPLPEAAMLLGDLAGAAQPVRSQRFGRAGLDLFVAAGAAGEVRARLIGRCREADAREAETLRVLAGVPRWGAELDENTMPAEAGLEERAVSYTKGCYIGQEVVSRVKSIGRVNRSLCGLLPENAAAVPDPGMLLYPVDAPEPRGREVGRITSVAPLPAGGFAAALAYVRRGSDSPGTLLDAFTAPGHPRNAHCRVQVCHLPFPL